jgi:hypothetical protein
VTQAAAAAVSDTAARIFARGTARLEAEVL